MQALASADLAGWPHVFDLSATDSCATCSRPPARLVKHRKYTCGQPAVLPAVPLDAGGRFDAAKFLEQSSPLSDSYPLTQLRPINTDYGVR
jgi:hypothetical protein